jgi:hypothetical protein
MQKEEKHILQKYDEEILEGVSGGALSDTQRMALKGGAVGGGVGVATTAVIAGIDTKQWGWGKDTKTAVAVGGTTAIVATGVMGSAAGALAAKYKASQDAMRGMR